MVSASVLASVSAGILGNVLASVSASILGNVLEYKPERTGSGTRIFQVYRGSIPHR